MVNRASDVASTPSTRRLRLNLLHETGSQLGRAAAAIYAAEDWLDSLDPLIELFAGTPASDDVVEHAVTGDCLRPLLDQTRYWLGSENYGTWQDAIARVPSVTTLANTACGAGHHDSATVRRWKVRAAQLVAASRSRLGRPSHAASDLNETSSSILDGVITRTALLEQFGAWHFDSRSHGLPPVLALEAARRERPHQGVHALLPHLRRADSNVSGVYFPALDAPTTPGAGFAERFRAAVMSAEGEPGDPVDLALQERAVDRILEVTAALPDLPPPRYNERRTIARAAYTDEARQIIAEACTAAGLTEFVPPQYRRYDHLLILGGGWKTPVLRAEFAAELIDDYQLDVDHVWLLGSARPVQPDERPDTDPWAPDAVDEYELMLAAGLTHFPPGHGDLERSHLGEQRRNPDWIAAQTALKASDDAIERTAVAETWLRTTTWVHDSKPVVAVSAPTGKAGSRASTSDTYRAFTDLISNSGALSMRGQRVLVVTNSIFVPFQGFEALRQLYLPHNMEVEITGYGADRADRQHSAENLLQETLSGIRSARRMLLSVTHLDS